jgi:hypothetical protein
MDQVIRSLKAQEGENDDPNQALRIDNAEELEREQKRCADYALQFDQISEEMRALKD